MDDVVEEPIEQAELVAAVEAVFAELAAGREMRLRSADVADDLIVAVFLGRVADGDQGPYGIRVAAPVCVDGRVVGADRDCGSLAEWVESAVVHPAVRGYDAGAHGERGDGVLWLELPA